MRHLLAAVLVAVLAAGPATAQEARRIIVTGTGEAEAAPDMATISVGVETQADEAAAALAENSQRMQALMDALSAEGIAAEDMQTSRLGLGPVWSDRRNEPEAPPEIVGYRAENILSVRVRNIGRTGTVIDALAGAGANRVSDIAFSVTEPKPLRDAALRNAVADARAKAQLIAESAGVRLGQVAEIRQLGGTPRPVAFEARADVAMDTPIAQGSVGISTSVEASFAIE